MTEQTNQAIITDEAVIIKEMTTHNGKRIGHITLNAPATLNALTLEMIELMLLQITQWQHDEDLVFIIIAGSGEKAFCAGGDIQALYQSARSQTSVDKHSSTNNFNDKDDLAARFFEREYRLDYLLHTIEKPIIAWGHGIIMGGGLGIFAGCKHRVVTEKTRLAMPEVSIGLYPDVGGSYFLNKMPGASGLFLALTSASLNAIDSCFVGLADYTIDHSQLTETIERLMAIDWQRNTEANNRLIQLTLESAAKKCLNTMPAGHIASQLNTINTLCQHRKLSDIVVAINQLSTDDTWLNKAKANLAYASPLSLAITAKQLTLSQHKSLKAVFNDELILSSNLVHHSEFSEGVRALLIDKDKKPQWQFKQVEDIPTECIDRFFISPWQKNPLSNL